MTVPNLSFIGDLRQIALPSYTRTDGTLIVIERERAIPFLVSRVFTVTAPAGAVRGQHAHRCCAQLLVCVHGSIAVECDDGEAKDYYLLDSGDKGLLIPASIWSTVTFRTDGAVLMVLCDRPFEEDDYIRNYTEFQDWRKNP